MTSLPVLRRCCCLPLETGFFLLAATSSLACIANISYNSWELQHHDIRQPEDNLISMSMVMFSVLSAIANLVGVAGVVTRRPGYVQMSFLFNSVFVLCIFLVSVVSCVYGTEMQARLRGAGAAGVARGMTVGEVLQAVAMLLVGAAYSMYYLVLVNSLYKKMKMNYSESSLPR